MIATSLFQVYLEINALLVLGYLVFAAMSSIEGSGKTKISHRQIVWLAQLLVILCILAPTAWHLVPAERMPEIASRDFQPPPEGFYNSKATRAAEKTRIQFPTVPQSQLSSYPGMIANAYRWLQANVSSSMATFFVYLWAIGFMVMLGRTLRNYRGLRLVVNSASVIRDLMSVKIGVSDAISVPFSAWMGRTDWVILPTSILRSRNDYALAIKHELQHHRYGDTRWAFFIEALVCVFFPNPAIYFWKKTINELQEFSCDEALVGQQRVSTHDYGSCLVRVAEAAFEGRQVCAGTACMAAICKNPQQAKSFLRRRIEMFDKHKSSQAIKWAGALLGTVATIGTVGLAFGAEQAIRKMQQKPNPGSVITDPAIQAIADSALRDAVTKLDAKSGFAIVTDPNTGRVLAVAEVDKTGKLKKNWPLNQVLEPASLAKTLVAAQAIESGLTTRQDKHSCENGNYKYAGRVYHDWKTNGWDSLTTEETIGISSDICTMKIGEKVGADGLYKMLVNFGFGPEGTAKTFPTARPGVLPPLINPQWPEMVPSISAGYGFHATPLELMQAYGAIANGGNLLLPKQANDNSAPQIVRRVLSAESANQSREILRHVVLKGTGKNHASSKLYSTAGKTATSYIPDLTQWELVEGKKKGNFAGFLGFAPVDKPQVEVYVGILDPDDGDKSGAHGSAHAAPVFKRIIEETLQHMKVAPDKE